MPNPEISIELDKSNTIYFAGEVLNGRVLVRIDSPTPVLGVHVWLKAEASIRLPDVNKQETIIELVTTVYGNSFNKSDRPTSTLAVGEHTYAFAIRIPPMLPRAPMPSSISGTFGYIRYFVEGHVERPGLSRALRIERDIVLFGSFDVNMDSTLRLPQEIRDNYTSSGCRCLCCCCCCTWRATGRIVAIFKTDKIGYAWGESMNVWTQIANRSDQDIHRLQLVLTQTIHYQTEIGLCGYLLQEQESMGVAVIDRLESLKAGRTHVYSEKSIVVPHGLVSSSTPESCRLLFVTYSIKLRGCIGTSDTFELDAPVIIGTIPSSNNVDRRSSEMIVT